MTEKEESKPRKSLHPTAMSAVISLSSLFQNICRILIFWMCGGKPAHPRKIWGPTQNSPRKTKREHTTHTHTHTHHTHTYVFDSRKQERGRERKESVCVCVCVCVCKNVSKEKEDMMTTRLAPLSLERRGTIFFLFYVLFVKSNNNTFTCRLEVLNQAVAEKMGRMEHSVRYNSTEKRREK